MQRTTTRRAPAATVPNTVPAQKLFAPVQARRVERRSILLRVFGELSPGVTILQAPAGHGKSVALGQIKQACEERGVVCAWLNLDESDNDSRRHANHLRALVGQVTGTRIRSGRTSKNKGEPRRPPQRADWLIDALTRLEREVALFIDEFEVISDRAILTFWRDFLSRRPASVRVFIATRSTPELGLARLLVGGRLLLLSADDLRFSRVEVHAYFGLHGEVSLLPAEIEAVYRRSEGWPAAVQLFRLSLSNPETRRTLGELDQSRPRELAEYLTESVLAGQLPDVREFLLRTSILTRLTAPLCDHLTGRTDSQTMLQRIEREGLFVRPLDTDLHWFRYHALFASLLLEQLVEADPGAVDSLHRSAARWLRDAGYYEDAMYHAVAAKEFSLACDILRKWSARLIASGEMATIGRWLDLIPKDRIDNDWALTIRVVWALTFLQRPARLLSHLKALDHLRARQDPSHPGHDESIIARAVAAMCADRIDEAQRLISNVPPCSQAVTGFDAFEQAAAENLRGYLSIFGGDLDGAHLHLTRARSFSELGDATFSGGYTACFEGALLLIEGRVQAALDCLREGLAQQRSVLDSSFVSAAIASCYLWALYEANDLDMLEAVADEYRDILQDAAVPDFFAVGQICIARVHLIRGHRDACVTVLEQAQYVATCNAWTRIVAMFELEKRAGPLRMPGPPPARKGMKNPPRERDRRMAEQASAGARWRSPANELLASTSFLLALENDAADENLGVSAREAEASYRGLRQRIGTALRRRAEGKATAALRTMRHALTLSSRTGLVRPLLDFGAEGLSLLRDLVVAAPQPGSIDGVALATKLLVDPLGGGSPSGESTRAPLLTYSSFTEREREILGLLSRRLSNKEIARVTLLSGNTVKYHLKNVFTKLGVGSRLEAYAAIIRLDLTHAPDPR